MISVKQAQELIVANAFPLRVESIPLSVANGRVLAADVTAPLDHPIFDQTAVDGYALHPDDIGSVVAIEVIGEVRAGDNPGKELKKGTAVRIFTGAPIPQGAGAVVMQEFVERKDNKIKVKDKGLKTGANIRRKGEQVKKGETALEKGALLNPASIGFLASLGIESVKVSCLPKVGIIATGNEFTEPGTELHIGQIYESNGIMLQAALAGMGIEATSGKTIDDINVMSAAIKQAAKENDILIVTGGVSVGKYDFTREALENTGFETIFHKVSQKPGKPILFAKKGNKAAFGLPGNPRAVLVCYYEYAAPFIRAVMGSNEPFHPTLQLQLMHDYSKKSGKSQFLAARYSGGGVKVLEGQGSHMLKSLSEADAIIELPADKENLAKGDLVKVHGIPNTV